MHVPNIEMSTLKQNISVKILFYCLKNVIEICTLDANSEHWNVKTLAKYFCIGSHEIIRC